MTRKRLSWKKHWYSQHEPTKYDGEIKGSAPKWKYAKEPKVASLNVRGMREISCKREHVVTYMKKHSIDLSCLPETKIPSPSIEQKNNYAFVFASSAEGAADHHGVGLCYNRGIEKYRNLYLQHSSHLAEMEINMHGDPLVILSAYMTHDASNEIDRLAAWVAMANRVGEIPDSNNVIVLGGFNAAIHARKPGEEECLGPHIWGKGLRFPWEKEGLFPGNMNRNCLIDLLKGYDMRCVNTFSPKT